MPETSNSYHIFFDDTEKYFKKNPASSAEIHSTTIKKLQEELTSRDHEISQLKTEKQEILNTLKLTLPKDSIPVQHIQSGQAVLYKYLGYIHPMENYLTDEDMIRLRGGQ